MTAASCCCRCVWPQPSADTQGVAQGALCSAGSLAGSMTPAATTLGLSRRESWQKRCCKNTLAAQSCLKLIYRLIFTSASFQWLSHFPVLVVFNLCFYLHTVVYGNKTSTPYWAKLSTVFQLHLPLLNFSLMIPDES